MAANMQQMAGGGQPMPQQLRRPNSQQIQQLVYQTLIQNTQSANGMAWQGSLNLNDRMAKTMDLYVLRYPYAVLAILSDRH